MGHQKKDIYFNDPTAGSEWKGFFLRAQSKEEGGVGKVYLHSTQEIVPETVSKRGITQRDGPGGRDIRIVFDSYHHGSGYRDWADARHGWESDRVDCREYGRLSLIPEPIQDQAVNSHDPDLYPACFCDWKGYLYVGIGYQLWQCTDPDLGNWTQRGSTTGYGRIHAMEAWGDYLVVTTTGGYLYTWNGTTFSQEFSGSIRCVKRIGNQLWISEAHKLQRTTNDDPTVKANFVGDIEIGDSYRSVEIIREFNGYPIAIKADGVYRVKDDGSVVTVYDSSQNMGDEAANRRIAETWGANFVFCTGGPHLYLLNTKEEMIDICPTAWCDMDNQDIHTLWGVAFLGPYIFLSCRGYWEGSETDMIWIGWQAVESGAQVMRWQMLIGDNDNVGDANIMWYNNYLVFVDSTDYLTRLPFRSAPYLPTIAGDIDYKTGELVTSQFDCGYPDAQKIWEKITVYLPDAIQNSAEVNITIEDHSGGEGATAIFERTSGGGAGAELQTEYIDDANVDGIAVATLKIEIVPPTTGIPPKVGYVILEGKLAPEEDHVFDMELLAEDYEDETGASLSSYLFDLSELTWFFIIDPNSRCYIVRMDADYPQELLVDDGNGGYQTVVRVRCRGRYYEDVA